MKLPAILVSFVTALVLAVPSSVSASDQAPQARSTGPAVSRAVRFSLTPPLRDMKVVPPDSSGGSERADDPGAIPADTGHTPDGALQGAVAHPDMPKPIRTFAGIGNTFGVAPPDPNIDVGPHNVVEMVNLAFAIYSKKGVL